jgi:hypothetical protein
VPAARCRTLVPDATYQFHLAPFNLFSGGVNNSRNFCRPGRAGCPSCPFCADAHPRGQMISEFTSFAQLRPNGEANVDDDVRMRQHRNKPAADSNVSAADGKPSWSRLRREQSIKVERDSRTITQGVDPEISPAHQALPATPAGRSGTRMRAAACRRPSTGHPRLRAEALDESRRCR